jgi:hypothetical protein
MLEQWNSGILASGKLGLSFTGKYSDRVREADEFWEPKQDKERG